MENDLISRKALQNALKTDGCDCEFTAMVAEAPAVEAEPVRHGQWIEKPYLLGTSRFCSLCGSNYGMPHEVYNFCPNCGAKMDEEKSISAQLESENMKPLTLEELRQMDGEPVYLEESGGYPLQCTLVYLFRGIARDCVFLTAQNGASISADLLLQRGGKVYRHKPKKENPNKRTAMPASTAANSTKEITL